MKHLALLLVAVGVGLTAAMGASPIEAAKERYELEMVALLEGVESSAALEDYCGARSELELPFNAQCPDPDEGAEEEANDEEAEEATEEEATEDAGPNLAEMTVDERTAHLLEVGQAELRASIDMSEDLPEDVAAARDAWMNAELETIAANAAVGGLEPLPAPGQRLSIWIGEKAPLFGLGLVLIIVGSLIARKEAHKEATGEGASQSGDSKGPVDFGELLASLADDVEAVAAEIEKADATSLEALKSRINELILEKVEPIVDAGPRVQVKYGLEGFAAIFAPFSAGERRLNRTWAALSDEHWPEAKDSIDRASTEFRNAVNEMSARSPS